MAINYVPQAMQNGVYGPNNVGDTYKPAPYHGVAAKRKKQKARWAYTSSCEYYVFNLADEHDNSIDENGIQDKKWMNDDGRGLYSLVDDCKERLGQEGERLAFFPTPVNANDPWHGYPIDSTNVGDNLILHWYRKKVISETTYLRLMRHRL